MNIEVMYCPKCKCLVRGVKPQVQLLRSGEVKVTAGCPTHTREKLVKVREAERERPDELMYDNPALVLPTVDLPASPGTLASPSTNFWEVFSKTIGQNLNGIEAQQNYEHFAKELWDDLSDDDKSILMERYRRTGRIEPESVPDVPPIDADIFISNGPRENPEEKPVKARSVDSGVKRKYASLDEEIMRRRAGFAALRDEFLRFDPDVARKVKLDYDALARIVGDKEYQKLVAEREEMLTDYGDGLFQ